MAWSIHPGAALDALRELHAAASRRVEHMPATARRQVLVRMLQQHQRVLRAWTERSPSAAKRQAMHDQLSEIIAIARGTEPRDRRSHPSG